MDSDLILLKAKDYLEDKAGALIGTVFFIIVVITSYDNIWQHTTSLVITSIILSSITVTLLLSRISSKRKLDSTKLHDFALALLFIYSICYLFGFFAVEYATYNARWLVVYSTAYILGRLMNTSEDRRHFFIIIYLVAIYQSVITLGQLNISQVFENGLSSIKPNSLKGNFSNSSMLACLMSTGILLGVNFLNNKNSTYFKALIILSFLFLVPTLFFSTSRAALLMLFLGILILFRIKWKYLVLVTFLSIAVFFTFKKDSIQGRFLIWKVSMEIISENPFFGVGTNRFGAVYNKYQGIYFEKGNPKHEEVKVSGNTFFSFNLPLKILVEYGLVGSVLLLLAIFSILIKVKKDWLLFSLLAGFLVFSLFSYPLDQLETSFLFFTLMGAASSQKGRTEYSLSDKTTRMIRIIICILSCLILLKEITILNNLKEWERQKVLQKDNPELYIHHLHKLNENLKGFPEFIFHYGAILVKNEQMEAAIGPLELCSNRLPSSNLYIYLGIAYEAVNEAERALWNYKFSTKIVPSLFIPKYYLFLHYKRTKRYVLAKKTALDILEQPVKVHNPKILEIKEDVSKFIKEAL